MNKKTNKFYGFLLAVMLGASSQAMAQANGDCASADPEKRSSKDSSCLPLLKYGAPTIDTPTPITGVTKTHSQQNITPFKILGKSCTTPWGKVISDRSGVIAHITHTGYYNYSTGTWAEECLEEFRFCDDGNLSGSYQYESCTLAPVNATCGPANGAVYVYPTDGPSAGSLCNPTNTLGGNLDGWPNTPANNGPYLDTSSNIYSWTCSGEAGGSNTSCSAIRRIHAQCGGTDTCALGNMGTHSENTSYYYYNCPPSSIVTTCVPGPATTPPAPPSPPVCTSTTVWAQCKQNYTDHNWQCLGINGGSNASCFSRVLF